jgi:hypothetical protein
MFFKSIDASAVVRIDDEPFQRFYPTRRQVQFLSLPLHSLHKKTAEGGFLTFASGKANRSILLTGNFLPPVLYYSPSRKLDQFFDQFMLASISSTIQPHQLLQFVSRKKAFWDSTFLQPKITAPE